MAEYLNKLVCVYHGILLGNKKEKTTDIYNLYDSPKNFAE